VSQLNLGYLHRLGGTDAIFALRIVLEELAIERPDRLVNFLANTPQGVWVRVSHRQGPQK
jgi:hypothetical protein